MKSNSTNRPSALESIGKGKWHYNYHIEEVEATEERAASFDYDCVEIQGTPTYDKCVTAVIRASYPADAEMALVNKYNAYQQGISDDASVVEEYAGFLQFVADTKAMVRQDLDVQEEAKPITASPRLADVARLLVMQINSLDLTDEQSLSVKSLYPEWDTFIGNKLEAGKKVQHSGKLWKVLQEVGTVLENQPPSIETASLYTEINETHAGTLEDPIPYNNNMELEAGKYYVQGGVTYRCTRSTEIPVYSDLKDLVEIYVEPVI